MKALAERILKHPLKVIKCFHMPKLLAVEKNNFIWNLPGGDFSSIQSWISSSHWEEPHPCLVLMDEIKYCRCICSGHWDATKRQQLSLFYSSGHPAQTRGWGCLFVDFSQPGSPCGLCPTDHPLRPGSHQWTCCHLSRLKGKLTRRRRNLSDFNLFVLPLMSI